MGFSLFSTGCNMRLGCGNWIKRLIILSLILNILYFPYQVYANPALAARVITQVFERVIARRAAVSIAGEAAANDAAFLAANEAAIGMRAAQTYRALGTVAANDSTFAISATSTLRHAKDISWVALALTSGVITLSDLNVESNSKIGVTFEPTTVLLSDGRYAINVNGETKIVKAMPSSKSPVIYQYSKDKVQISEGKDDIHKSDILDNHYKYYYELKTGEYAQSNSISLLSEYGVQEDYSVKSEDKYTEISIEGSKYSYLESQTIVENKYLRHKVIGNTIYADVRNTWTYKSLSSNFNPVLEGNTGTNTIYSFNQPKPSDYEEFTRTDSKSITIEINNDFTGDTSTALKEKELGSISELDLNLYTTPLTATQLAQLYNALLMSAAMQPDYSGIPFASSYPITAAEVQQVLNKLGITPTYADLFTKAGKGNQIDFPMSSPKPLPNPSPNPSPNIRPDKDDDDAEGEPEYPELEAPTAMQILEPFNQFFPQLKNFHLADRAVQCPKWEGHIDYLNIDVRLDKHCQYVEQNKAVITSLMLLIWGIVALRILLSA